MIWISKAIHGMSRLRRRWMVLLAIALLFAQHGAKVVVDETVIEGSTKPYIVYKSDDETQPRRVTGTNHH